MSTFNLFDSTSSDESFDIAIVNALVSDTKYYFNDSEKFRSMMDQLGRSKNSIPQQNSGLTLLEKELTQFHIEKNQKFDELFDRYQRRSVGLKLTEVSGSDRKGHEISKDMMSLHIGSMKKCLDTTNEKLSLLLICYDYKKKAAQQLIKSHECAHGGQIVQAAKHVTESICQFSTSMLSCLAASPLPLDQPNIQNLRGQKKSCEALAL